MDFYSGIINPASCERLNFAIPVFHAYGHKAECQVYMHYAYIIVDYVKL